MNGGMAQGEGEGEVTGLVSVRAQRAASEGPRWTREWRLDQPPR